MNVSAITLPRASASLVRAPVLVAQREVEGRLARRDEARRGRLGSRGGRREHAAERAEDEAHQRDQHESPERACGGRRSGSLGAIEERHETAQVYRIRVRRPRAHE